MIIISENDDLKKNRKFFLTLLLVKDEMKIKMEIKMKGKIIYLKKRSWKLKKITFFHCKIDKQIFFLMNFNGFLVGYENE